MKLFNKHASEIKRAELIQRMFDCKKQDGTWESYNKRKKEIRTWKNK